jgi:hypothetical protein
MRKARYMEVEKRMDRKSGASLDFLFLPPHAARVVSAPLFFISAENANSSLMLAPPPLLPPQQEVAYPVRPRRMVAAESLRGGRTVRRWENGCGKRKSVGSITTVSLGSLLGLFFFLPFIFSGPAFLSGTTLPLFMTCMDV